MVGVMAHLFFRMLVHLLCRPEVGLSQWFWMTFEIFLRLSEPFILLPCCQSDRQKRLHNIICILMKTMVNTSFPFGSCLFASHLKLGELFLGELIMFSPALPFIFAARILPQKLRTPLLLQGPFPPPSGALWDQDSFLCELSGSIPCSKLTNLFAKGDFNKATSLRHVMSADQGSASSSLRSELSVFHCSQSWFSVENLQIKLNLGEHFFSFFQ